MRKDSIVLIGMAGVGKSTIGLRLAGALGFSFTDLDEYISTLTRQTLQHIIDERGEKALLFLEEQSMYELNLDHRVVAPGGSIVYHPNLMEYLKGDSFIVYLNDTFENIKKRLTNASTRGIIGYKTKSLREIFDERQPLYLKYADVVVNQEGKSQQLVIRDIIRNYFMYFHKYPQSKSVR
ncbi:shikimate kinase [Chloroflexota bacterium]